MRYPYLSEDVEVQKDSHARRLIAMALWLLFGSIPIAMTWGVLPKGGLDNDVGTTLDNPELFGIVVGILLTAAVSLYGLGIRHRRYMKDLTDDIVRDSDKESQRL